MVSSPHLKIIPILCIDFGSLHTTFSSHFTILCHRFTESSKKQKIYQYVITTEKNRVSRSTRVLAQSSPKNKQLESNYWTLGNSPSEFWHDILIDTLVCSSFSLIRFKGSKYWLMSAFGDFLRSVSSRGSGQTGVGKLDARGRWCCGGACVSTTPNAIDVVVGL